MITAVLFALVPPLSVIQAANVPSIGDLLSNLSAYAAILTAGVAVVLVKRQGRNLEAQTENTQAETVVALSTEGRALMKELRQRVNDLTTQNHELAEQLEKDHHETVRCRAEVRSQAIRLDALVLFLTAAPTVAALGAAGLTPPPEAYLTYDSDDGGRTDA